MSLKTATRKLVLTVHVKECQQCPQFLEGVPGHSDDWCKEARAFIWKKGDDCEKLFPDICPLKEE